MIILCLICVLLMSEMIELISLFYYQSDDYEDDDPTDNLILIFSLPPPLSFFRYSECDTSKQCKMNVAYSRGCACFVSSTIHKFNPCRDPVNPLDEDEQCNGECPADSCDGRKARV